MKTLDFEQMEMIEGGTACEAVAVIGTIAELHLCLVLLDLLLQVQQRLGWE